MKMLQQNQVMEIRRVNRQNDAGLLVVKVRMKKKKRLFGNIRFKPDDKRKTYNANDRTIVSYDTEKLEGCDPSPAPNNQFLFSCRLLTTVLQ